MSACRCQRRRSPRSACTRPGHKRRVQRPMITTPSHPSTRPRRLTTGVVAPARAGEPRPQGLARAGSICTGPRTARGRPSRADRDARRSTIPSAARRKPSRRAIPRHPVHARPRVSCRSRPVPSPRRALSRCVACDGSWVCLRELSLGSRDGRGLLSGNTPSEPDAYGQNARPLWTQKPQAPAAAPVMAWNWSCVIWTDGTNAAPGGMS
jgi:hypothetical protein